MQLNVRVFDITELSVGDKIYVVKNALTNIRNKLGANYKTNSEDTNKLVTGAYKKMEKEIASLFGTKRLGEAKQNIGLQPDIMLTRSQSNKLTETFFNYFNIDQTSNSITTEVKSVYAKYDKGVSGEIKLQGSAGGFILSKNQLDSGDKNIATPTGTVQANRDQIGGTIDAFNEIKGKIKKLQDLPRNDIIKVIEQNKFLKDNILSKASYIKIPLLVDGKPLIRVMQFDWQHLKQYANFVIKKLDTQSVNISISYPQGFINSIFKIISKNEDIIIRSVFDNIVPWDASQVLRLEGIAFGVEYLAGSIRVADIHGKIDLKAMQNKATTTNPTVARSRFISSVQLTVLLQQIIANKMPKYGPADPSRGLTYRTGKFVRSLAFMIDYRKRLVTYYTLPPVDEYADKLHRRPYAVGARLIGPSIRQVTRTLFGQSFGVLRAT